MNVLKFCRDLQFQGCVVDIQLFSSQLYGIINYNLFEVSKVTLKQCPGAILVSEILKCDQRVMCLKYEFSNLKVVCYDCVNLRVMSCNSVSL